eukprot:TRINITY_DN18880_c0_g1_i1.p1 TRINITY_DN18880_c0_g1~~TRINITY_DN18880_c0_g1_i1.p1  ORF type:complete len:513 (+),score=75.04 TRINITY_DN18880_c0_g1_i1:2-1540(+)
MKRVLVNGVRCRRSTTVGRATLSSLNRFNVTSSSSRTTNFCKRIQKRTSSSSTRTVGVASQPTGFVQKFKRINQILFYTFVPAAFIYIGYSIGKNKYPYTKERLILYCNHSLTPSVARTLYNLSKNPDYNARVVLYGNHYHPITQHFSSFLALHNIPHTIIETRAVGEKIYEINPRNSYSKGESSSCILSSPSLVITRTDDESFGQTETVGVDYSNSFLLFQMIDSLFHFQGISTTKTKTERIENYSTHEELNDGRDPKRQQNPEIAMLKPLSPSKTYWLPGNSEEQDDNIVKYIQQNILLTGDMAPLSELVGASRWAVEAHGYFPATIGSWKVILRETRRYRQYLKQQEEETGEQRSSFAKLLKTLSFMRWTWKAVVAVPQSGLKEVQEEVLKDELKQLREKLGDEQFFGNLRREHTGKDLVVTEQEFENIIKTRRSRNLSSKDGEKQDNKKYGVQPEIPGPSIADSFLYGTLKAYYDQDPRIINESDMASWFRSMDQIVTQNRRGVGKKV